MSDAKQDDLNKYLTWGNVIKVILFLVTPFIAISAFLNKATLQEYEVKNISQSLKDINITVKELKTTTENMVKEANTRISSLESRVQILEIEVKVMKENQTKR